MQACNQVLCVLYKVPVEILLIRWNWVDKFLAGYAGKTSISRSTSYNLLELEIMLGLKLHPDIVEYFGESHWQSR